jgi:hypothetical protein
MKQKGLGSTWVITYSKEDQLNITSQFRVSQGTTAMNIGRHKFTVNFPK